jgi:hypothetical protein
VVSIVDFYTHGVYQGALSTDGNPLPGGQPEAIPIDAQVQEGDNPELDATLQESGTDRNQQLRLGIAELWNTSNYSMLKNLRPMYGAVLGDCLTELIDDIEGRKVLPVTIWPGYVAALELDSVGNVKYVAIQYDVHERPTKKADIGVVKERQYTLRREMDGESFRWYEDDDLVKQIENPYRAPGEERGFVPCIWDRHKVGLPGSTAGLCAFEDTIQALMETNSFLSHALDQQRKAFAAPIIIQGTLSRIREGISLSRPNITDMGYTEEAAIQHAMERQDILTATGSQVGLHNIPVDLGQTMAILDWMKQGIDRENPEGTFYEKLGQAGNLTGPGADRALGDATSRLRSARSGYDANSVKAFQMWLAICGMRVNLGTAPGGWGPIEQLSRRQRAWLPFDMESYRKGHLDFTIQDRPVVLPTPEEAVNLVILKEAVQTEWGMRQVGIADDDITATLSERKKAAEAQAAMFSLAGAGGAPAGDGEVVSEETGVQP